MKREGEYLSENFVSTYIYVIYMALMKRNMSVINWQQIQRGRTRLLAH